MRNGILHFDVCDAACKADSVASPPVPTVFNMQTGSNCGPAGNSPCDPRGLGINPVVLQMWTKFMPAGNDPSCGTLFGSRCDGVNVIGFKANMAQPYRSDFAVARIDHDFGSKWHFTTSYRYYKLTRATNSQIDIGGFFPGDTLGTPASLSARPQQPWYLVAGLTTNITSNTTNDSISVICATFGRGMIRRSRAVPRAWWALEPLGEQQFNVLAPYNVNTQSIRTRFWDGRIGSSAMTSLCSKGTTCSPSAAPTSAITIGTSAPTMAAASTTLPPTRLGDSTGGGLIDFSATLPAGATSSKWARDSAAVLGIVTDSQIAYTRAGANLALNPPLTHAFDQSTIPYYNVYFSDSWHMKPSFTLTYGLGWTLEMPPTEKHGKQIELVDQSGQQLDTMAYLNARKAAALQGQVYNPEVGFALVGNTGGGQKYPYQPYYGSFSPRGCCCMEPQLHRWFLGENVRRQ